MFKSLATHALIELIERGWMPDRLTRKLARRLCADRLNGLRQTQGATTDHGVEQFAEQMRLGPIAPVPEKANEQHYEVPADFFTLILGSRLKYSCCYFSNAQSSLDQAECAALETTCRHAEIENGMEVLELGCGWGSLTLWMLEKYPAIRVTAVSNSQSQRAFIEQRATAIGAADRLSVITCDMNDFRIDRRFDRVVSCEMFEHMRNYEALLGQIASWLRPDGKLFVHIFCHKDFAYEFQTDGAANWLGRYFFTGGIMPSSDLLTKFDSDLAVAQQWHWDGTHYERTCNAWLELLDQRRESALQVLAQTYGPKQAKRWLQRWRLFLIAGAELFGFENGSEWIVGHFLLEHAAKRPTKSSVLQTERDAITLANATRSTWQTAP